VSLLRFEGESGVDLLGVVRESNTILEVNVIQIFLQEVCIEPKRAYEFSVLGLSDTHLVHHWFGLVTLVGIDIKLVGLKSNVHDVVSSSNVHG
jgi:hypothetical protein